MILVQLDLLGAAAEAEVPGRRADDDALVVVVAVGPGEAIGAAAVQGLVDERGRVHGVVVAQMETRRGTSIARGDATLGSASFRGASPGSEP